MKELVIVKNLIKHFNASKGLFKPKTETIYAVNNISFSINQGETLSLVGESGCGKSTVGKCLIGLEKPTSGEIIIDGIKTTTSTKKRYQRTAKKSSNNLPEPLLKPESQNDRRRNSQRTFYHKYKFIQN